MSASFTGKTNALRDAAHRCILAGGTLRVFGGVLAFDYPEGMEDQAHADALACGLVPYDDAAADTEEASDLDRDEGPGFGMLARAFAPSTLSGSDRRIGAGSPAGGPARASARLDLVKA